VKLHLTRLRVEQLRRFRGTFELRDLDPGLNLITGANESGKSTLARALRAAFLERHRSTTVDDLRPLDEPAAAPEVQLDFTLNGAPHRLVKRFLSRKRCLLDLPDGRQLEGVEAEDWLAQQFGFQFALRGGSRPEHWGIPGLLWVEQGCGHDLDGAALHAHSHLHDALQQLGAAVGGSLVATGGDAVLHDLQAQRAQLLTSTGRPRGPLLQAQEEVQSLQTQLDALDGQITQHRQQVDMLAGLQARETLDNEQRPWESLAQQLQTARARHAEVEQWAHRLDTLRQQQQHSQQQQVFWQAQRQALTQQTEALTQREQTLLACAARLAPARAQVEALQGVLQRATAQLVNAREAVQRARHADKRRQWQHQWQEAWQTRQQLEGTLARAQTEQQHLDALRAQLPPRPLDRTQLQRLVQLERAQQDGMLRRQAAAARLQFQLPDGQRLRLETAAGVPLRTVQGEGELRLEQATTVHLAEGGWLRFEPGDTDWQDWARQERRAHDELAAALHQAGVDSVAQAQEQHTQAAQVQQRLELAQQALAWIAPQGLDALRDAVAQANAREQQAHQQLAQCPAPEAADEAPELSMAEAQLQQHQQAEQRAQQQLQQAREQLIGCERDHANALQERDTAWATLTDPAHAQRQTEVNTQLDATAQALHRLAQDITTLQAQWQAAQPERVRQDIERLERSLAQLEHTRQQRRLDMARLEASLQQAGAQGLEEERAQIAGTLARAQQRQTEWQHRAEALDWLCQRLLNKRQAALVRLQTPLQARLRHYLSVWMPEADLHLDEQLTPIRLSRPSAHGVAQRDDFERLSFGAREQLALIARLAYADVLRDAGRPTLLLLDDVLSHSDAQRLTRMKPVLYDAATRHQVLLFSCHPELWQDLGVPARDLDWLPLAPSAVS
jgi:energy-coupling factor transporter ATP-binding protein EcfA2